MKRLPVVLASAALCLLFASGCKNKCLELAQRICECESTSTLRENCNQRASEQGNRVTVTPTDEANCAALMGKCDCHALDTPEGKLNCGMARPADWK
ncbi:MAG TPA: hypothetical protein VGK67_22090 [Myxococcales bacterium]|jgi:hypothetical protein